jgi:lipoprotein-anchoring transpeptidase ErfK/SrfK
MRILTMTLAAVAALALGQQSARAGLVITVDKSAQRLSVEVNGFTRYTWPTSTARAGYSTPNGNYRPQWLARKWFSTKYHGSPMPYSIFFHHGFAIHGSYEISYLGRPASHGCVRLHPDNAALLFALVQQHGNADTRIVVTGTRPAVSVERTRNRRGRSAAVDRSDDEPGIDYARRRWENMQ